MASVQEVQEVQQIELKNLRSSPFNVRRRFNADSIGELAESIQSQGVIVPLIVRPLTDGLAFEIIAGERRSRAARQAGLKAVPCLVRNLGDEEARVEQILENLQREDVTALEEAQGFQALLKAAKGYEPADGQKTAGAVQTLAKRIGKSKEYVYQRLQLLKLEPPVQRALAGGKLQPSQAIELVSLDAPQQETMLRVIETDPAMTVEEIRIERKSRFQPKRAPQISARERAARDKAKQERERREQYWKREAQKSKAERELRDAVDRRVVSQLWAKLQRLSGADAKWGAQNVLESRVMEGSNLRDLAGILRPAMAKALDRNGTAKEISRKTVRQIGLQEIRRGRLVSLALLCLFWDSVWGDHSIRDGILKRFGLSWNAVRREEIERRRKAVAAALPMSTKSYPVAKPVPAKKAAGKAKPNPARKLSAKSKKK